MILTFSFLPNAKRAWRAARFPIDTRGAVPPFSEGSDPIFFGKTATLIGVNSAEIECKFYTPEDSQLQDARCVVNYHEIGIYRTANFGKHEPPATDPRTYGFMTAAGFPQFKTAQLTSSNLQLSSCPLYPSDAADEPTRVEVLCFRSPKTKKT